MSAVRVGQVWVRCGAFGAARSGRGHVVEVSPRGERAVIVWEDTAQTTRVLTERMRPVAGGYRLVFDPLGILPEDLQGAMDALEVIARRDGHEIRIGYEPETGRTRVTVGDDVGRGFDVRHAAIELLDSRQRAGRSIAPG